MSWSKDPSSIPLTAHPFQKPPGMAPPHPNNTQVEAIQLKIFELKNSLQTDVTTSYDASFFVFATLEVSHSVAPHRELPRPSRPTVPVLTGIPVSGPTYSDRFSQTIFFSFYDLSIRHEGEYRLCFTLFDKAKRLEDEDATATGPRVFSEADSSTNTDPITQFFHKRLEIKSNQFTVSSSKKVSRITKSTTSSKALAEQGRRTKIRRDVTTRCKEEEDYDSGCDVDRPPLPFAFPWLNVQHERFPRTLTRPSTKENMESMSSGSNYTMRELPQLRPTTFYKLDPAPTPPPTYIMRDWSPRERFKRSKIRKRIRQSENPDTDPPNVYINGPSKGSTNAPDVEDQYSLQDRGILDSHLSWTSIPATDPGQPFDSEVAFVSNKQLSLDHSAERVNKDTFEDSSSWESFGLDLPGPEPGSERNPATSQSIQKKHDLSRNDSTWESLKEHINMTYMTQNNTLRHTMTKIEEMHAFKATERQWKHKLKSWGFEKDLSASNMQFVVTKWINRRAAGKDTVFSHRGVEIPAHKIEMFKRRTNINDSDSVFPSANAHTATPETITYGTPPSDTESMTDSDKTITHDVNQDDLYLASGSHAAISREEIWSALRSCLGSITKASSRGHSANETTIIPVDGEPLSHIIKRSCQEWWLAHTSDPWENIFSGVDLTVFDDKRLLHLMFSSWHQDWINGSPSLRESGFWLRSLVRANEQEDSIVEQLIRDILVQLDRANAAVKNTPAGDSTSNAPSGSASAISGKSYETSKASGKRRERNETESGDDELGDDDPYQNGITKRIKKTTDDLNRYVICTQFATSRALACNLTKCFFGAWCSVDRLKQDHLIKVHKFEISQMQIDRGGTESEKWWRLFDKLNPGFRDANPEKLIPGPFYEDRVAHNTYNKLFSEAMQRAERIQQRRAQNLASDIQSLLNKHQHGERQEIRQVVLDVLHSRDSDATSSGRLSMPEDMQSESNSFHNERGAMSTYLLQQSNADSSTPSDLICRSLLPEPQINSPGDASTSNEPSFHEHFSDAPESHASSPWQHREMNTSIGTQPSSSSHTPDILDKLGVQNGADAAMTTASSSMTTPWTLLAANDLGCGQPLGRVCRCRHHNAECD